MATVFRFHKGNNNIEGWQASEAYGSHAINGIQDPAGETATQQITSIPSPFARMDLVQTAFKRINEGRQVEGTTIFHKMISDCLDVAEVLFNIDRFPDQFELLAWDKKQDLQALLASKNQKHKRLGETLQLYLEQDQAAHHFDRLNSIYLLNYKAGPHKLNIIGGTSPSTLFFTSANDLSYVNVLFGSKRVFSDTYLPLFKREMEFQQYLYGIQKFFPDFNVLFKEVDDYLNANFALLNTEQRQVIHALSEGEYNSRFATLMANHDGNPVELFAYPLRKKVNNPATIAESSDFVIASSKFSGLKPLVLPNEKFTEKRMYTTDYWDSKQRAPYVDEIELESRSLPFVGDKYPYLTVDDLLEPYLIRTVYPIQKDKFFDGNLQSPAKNTKGLLIPIKREFFKYFDSSFLQEHLGDGKPVFEMKMDSKGAVTVRLRIPIASHDPNLASSYITFQRIYYPSANELAIEKPDVEQNKGVIVENQFTIAIFPFFRLSKDTANFYRIALMDRDILPLTKTHNYSLAFFQDDTSKELPIKAKKNRSKKQSDGVSSHFHVVEHPFDFIAINDGAGHSGLIIPLFREIQPGTARFTFAIDFGTTNTHIEYRKGDVDPTPFEINEDDVQMATLHDPDIEETDLSLSGTGAASLILTIPHEFLPLTLGQKHPYAFPTRTVLHYNESANFKATTYALADMNLSFTFERELIPKNITFDTHLKWSDFKANTKELKKVDAYFENLILLIRNKVWLNGGDPDQTELVWFYPSSMLPFKIGMMEAKWEQLFHRYVTDKKTPMKLSESIAPFYYFKNRLGVTASDRPVVSIDIGGGTSDIVVYTHNRPEVLTSIRFAADTIFGDGYNSNPELNGFVLKYTEKFKDLSIVSYYLPKLRRSDDIAGFFFSLENNRDLQKHNIDASFAKELHQDADLRIIFLLFYSAIIYHLAKLMKVKGLETPAYLTFSGTGSKVINFADPGPKLKGLKKLTEKIFEKVNDKNNGKGDAIELKQYKNPKEITCKGGLMIDTAIEIEDIKSVLLGDETDRLMENTQLDYNTISEKDINSVLNEYGNFIDLFFEVYQELNFTKEFGVNPTHAKLYREILTSKAREYLLLGIEHKIKELGDEQDVPVGESLFFYPLTGSINRLVYEVVIN